MKGEAHATTGARPANPYPGIRAFRREEGTIFFGRDDQIDGLLERLHASRLVAVAGESGCGKSSLVRAGLLPTLQAGFLPGAGARWHIADLRPGSRPLANLAIALSAALETGSSEADSALVAARLRQGPLSLVELLRDRPLPPESELLILVDQFEELIRFRSRIDPNEADAFVALLLRSVGGEVPVRIVLTLRTDYLGECALFRGLPEMLNGCQYLVPRLEREELIDAITSPARVFDGDVDPTLANHIVNELKRDQDQLPVLEHALHWMWTRATAQAGSDAPAAKGTDGATITLSLADYESLGGGLGDALSKHAEGVYAGLGSEANQAIARKLFCALWDEHAEERDARRPCTVAEAAEIAGVTEDAVRSVAEVFRKIEHSLLMPPPELELTSATVLDVAHESLFRHWGRLSEWTRAETKDAEQFRRWSADAIAWRDGTGDLLTDRNLDAADVWLKAAAPTGAWARRYSRGDDDFALLERFLCESREASAKRMTAEVARKLEQRRAWLRRVTTTIAALALCFGVLGVLLHDVLYVWEHEDYYRGFIELTGEAQGVGKITAPEARQRQISAKVITAGRRGHVKRVYWMNRQGENIDVPKLYMEADETAQAFARMEYEYGPDDKVSSIGQFAKSGQFVQGRVSTPAQLEGANALSFVFLGAKGAPTAVRTSPRSAYFWTETIRHPDDGYNEIRTYLGRDGEAIPGRDWAFGSKFRYDGEGNLIAQVSVNARGQPMNDTFGNAGLVYTNDSHGNAIQFVATNAAGEVTRLIHGYAIARMAYDAYGNLIEQSLFDEHGRAVSGDEGWHRCAIAYDTSGAIEAHYFDELGAPTTSTLGCYGIRQDFDANGRPARLTCLEPDGKPRIAKEGYVSIVRQYDARGREVLTRFLDERSEPMLSADGLALIQRDYDARGRLHETRFLGVRGEPVIGRSRSAGTTIMYSAGTTVTYDDSRHTRSTTSWGLLHEPVVNKQGFATIEEELDSFGSVVMQHYYDAQSVPVRFDGYDAIRMIYDNHGEVVETLYLGESGGIVFSNDGYGGFRAEYDSLGRMSKASYLGVRHEPVTSNVGVAGWHSRYDAWGNEIERRYFGLDGKPTVAPSGEAGWDADYNGLGDQTAMRYLDTTGASTLQSWDGRAFTGTGNAAVKRVYDAHRRLLREEFYDLSAKLAVSPGGWSRRVHEYDLRGNEVRTSYFDGAERVADRTTNAHVVVYEYDLRGNAVDVRYIGVDGVSPIRNVDGYAHLLRKYDNFDEVAEESFLDVNEQPVARDGGYRHLTVRNPAGLVVSEEAYDAKENRITWVQKDYDSSRRLLAERHLDPQQSQPVPAGSAEMPCATLQVEYPSESREIHRCLDAHDRLTRGPHGYAWYEITWGRPGKAIAESYFDAEGRPFVRNGYASVSIKYDESWRETEMTFLGADGTEAMNEQGIARRTLAYDSNGNVVKQAFFARKDAPLGAQGYTYDGMRRIMEERYFAAGDQAVRYNGNGQYVTERVYDAYGTVIALRYWSTDGKTPMKGYSTLLADGRLCAYWVPRYVDRKIVSASCDRAPRSTN